MKTNRNIGKGAALLTGALLLLTLSWGAALAEDLTQEERIAALKQSMAASQEALKAYQWTESTTVSYEGEEKSHSTAKCSYDADGKVVKEVTSAPQEHKKKRGLRGRKAESKQKEIKEYMGRAKELIATYVPPNPENIQKCKDAGKISIEMVEPGKTVVLRLKDYQLPGDSVGIKMDLATNTMKGYEVDSYLDSPEGAVVMKVSYEKLEDGTVYPSVISLDAAAESILVEISNTDYRHAGN